MHFQHLFKQSLLWRGAYYASLLCLNIAIARAFGASETATVFYLSNLFSLLVLAGGMSLENAFIYYASRKIITTAKMVWFGLVWIICISVLAGAVAYVYFHFAEPVQLFHKNLYVIWAVLFTAGTLFINFYSGLFYAADNFKTPNLIAAVFNLLMSVIVAFAAYLDADINVLLSRYFYLFLLQGSLIFSALVISRKQYRQLQLPSYAESRLLLQYGLQALVANIVFFLVYRVDYWIVINKCSSADAGNYMQASRFAQLLWLVPQMLATVVFPKTAAGIKEEEIKKIISGFARAFTFIYLFIFVLIALCGHFIFPFLLGNSFNKVSSLLLLLMPGVWALSVLSIYSAYFAGINKVIINSKGALSGLVTVTIVSIAVWNLYNIYIAAIISSVSYCVCFMYAFKTFSKQHDLPLKKLLIFDKADWAFIINLISKNRQ